MYVKGSYDLLYTIGYIYCILITHRVVKLLSPPGKEYIDVVISE